MNPHGPDPTSGDWRLLEWTRSLPKNRDYEKIPKIDISLLLVYMYMVTLIYILDVPMM